MFISGQAAAMPAALSVTQVRQYQQHQGGIQERKPVIGGAQTRRPVDSLHLSPEARETYAATQTPAEEGAVEETGSRENSDTGSDSTAATKGKSAKNTTGDTFQLSPEAQQKLMELKKRDMEVKTHEAAHAAVGGRYASSPSVEYEVGPDGKRYAVAGEVRIDTSKVPGDPAATMRKADTIRAAALAPAHPSAQDRMVAAKAAQMKSAAQAELLAQNVADGKQMVTNATAQTPTEANNHSHTATDSRINTPELDVRA